MDEIEAVYRMWRDKPFGADVWCLIRRKEMPQKPVEEAMREAGWNMDMLKAEHGLRNNHYDGTRNIELQRKYGTYAAWEQGRGRKPQSFEGDWWEGWLQYADAHPGWNDEAWKIEKLRLDVEWRRQNGYLDEYIWPGLDV